MDRLAHTTEPAPTLRGELFANILNGIIMAVAIAALQEMIDLETMAGVTVGLGALGIMANFSSGDFRNRIFNFVLYHLVTTAMVAVAACILAGELPQDMMAPTLFLSLTVFYIAVRLLRFCATSLCNRNKSDTARVTRNHTIPPEFSSLHEGRPDDVPFLQSIIRDYKGIEGALATIAHTTDQTIAEALAT